MHDKVRWPEDESHLVLLDFFAAFGRLLLAVSPLFVVLSPSSIRSLTSTIGMIPERESVVETFRMEDGRRTTLVVGGIIRELALVVSGRGKRTRCFLIMKRKYDISETQFWRVRSYRATALSANIFIACTKITVA